MTQNYVLPDQAAKAKERKGKRLPLSQQQDRSVADRNIPVSLAPAPWDVEEIADE